MFGGKEEKVAGSVWQYFLLLLLCSCAFLGVILFVFYQQHLNFNTNIIMAEERHSINIQHKALKIHLNSIVSDLLAMSEQDAVRRLLDNVDGGELTVVNGDYRAFSKIKKHYDQVRILNNNGQEVMRVNYAGGEPKSIVGDQLQSKQKRYYFKDTHELEKGEVYISPFDLNIEHGKVEVPLKPMIRFGTPVFALDGSKLGIVLLNYRGQDLLDIIHGIGSDSYGQMMLINPQGFWLQHPEPNKQWGFMLKERAEENFAKQYAEAWPQILSGTSGVVKTRQGAFLFSTIEPLDAYFVSSTGSDKAFDASGRKVEFSGYYWKVVSFISEEAFAVAVHRGLRNFLLFVGVLFSMLFAASWFLATNIIKRKLSQQQIFKAAHFDQLTGLPNRSLFADRLNQAILLAKRKNGSCALFFIDLDGFKQVNDNLGHDAGDELLIEVSNKLVACCRESDTVARMGGDEFTIVVNSIKDAAGCAIVAEKILETLRAPFDLQQGEVRIGVSIGIAMYPNAGGTAELLLKSADSAMYEVKNGGKNSYQIVPPAC